MFERFRQRSLELERLDRGDYTPEEYEGCLVELRRVNRWLGDSSALRRAALRDIERDGAQESREGQTENSSYRLFSHGRDLGLK